MRYLLDTCALLWLAEANEKLSLAAQDMITDRANEGALSTVSLWELSMKSVVGKLHMPMSPADLGDKATSQGLQVLSLSVAHVDRFHRLGTAHRDPFDRLLAAVALSENLTLVSPDHAFDVLGIVRLW